MHPAVHASAHPLNSMIEPNEPAASPQNQPTLTSRRGILGGVGFAGLGLFAGLSPASAFTSARKTDMPRVSVATANQGAGHANRAIPYTVRPDLPEEWEARNGRMASEYLRYLNGLGLRRVNASQVLASHAKQSGSVWNTLPPTTWWRRMGYTLKVLERIAMELNVSQVEVISAYRSPSYNARSGGKTGSWHQANAAVDVRFPVRARTVTATARELRNLGLFRGGVGGYWNFTHIDCRGDNVDW
jgi:hypothetical protein